MNSLFALPIVFSDEENLSGLVFLDSITDLSVKPFFASGLSNFFVVSPVAGVSDLKSFRAEKIDFEDCLNYKTIALRILGESLHRKQSLSIQTQIAIDTHVGLDFKFVFFYKILHCLEKRTDFPKKVFEIIGWLSKARSC